MARYKISNVKSWMRQLPENKWRKTYNVDARRVAHFANLGEEVELPETLNRKTGDGSYIREKRLAKEYVKCMKKEERKLKLENKIRKMIRSLIKEELNDE